MKRALIAAALLCSTPAIAKRADPMTAAVQLVAVASFVQQDCPSMTVDFDVIDGAVEAMGVAMELVGTDLMVGRAAQMVYEMREAKNSCQIAWKQFGENGATLPHMLRRR